MQRYYLKDLINWGIAQGVTRGTVRRIPSLLEKRGVCVWQHDTGAGNALFTESEHDVRLVKAWISWRVLNPGVSVPQDMNLDDATLAAVNLSEVTFTPPSSKTPQARRQQKEATPAAETPAIETPPVETPPVETPAVETPAAPVIATADQTLLATAQRPGPAATAIQRRQQQQAQPQQPTPQQPTPQQPTPKRPIPSWVWVAVGVVVVGVVLFILIKKNNALGVPAADSYDPRKQLAKNNTAEPAGMDFAGAYAQTRAGLKASPA